MNQQTNRHNNIKLDLDDERSVLEKARNCVRVSCEDIENHLREYHNLDKQKYMPGILYCMQDAEHDISDALARLKDAYDLMDKYYKPKSE